MERLPMEILDHIADFVAALRDRPDLDAHLLYPSMDTRSSKAEAALKNLRLVDKSFCRSASRALFAIVRVNFVRGISSVLKLEALSTSDYAKHVRFIRFNFYGIYESYLDEESVQARNEDTDTDSEPQEDSDFEKQEEMDEESVIEWSHKASNYLSYLLGYFRNLKGFGVWNESYLPSRKLIRSLSQLMVTIANLQLRGILHKVIEAAIHPDCVSKLVAFLETSESRRAIQHFLHNLQHLSVHADFIPRHALPQSYIDIGALISTSCNLICLKVSGGVTTTLVPFRELNPDLKPQLESLDLSDLEISSYGLMSLLKECEESLRFISLDRVKLSSGSWLHVLVHIVKYKNLIKFNFQFSERPPELMTEEILQETIDVCHAVGDIQRQTNAKRIATGLKPWDENVYLYLDLEPLKDVIEKERYKNLSLEDWDVDEPRTSYLDLLSNSDSDD